MPNTYNVGAINSGLQDLSRTLFQSGSAMAQGDKNAAQTRLIEERIASERAGREAQELANGQARAAEELVPGLAQTFFNMLNPMIPQRAVDAGVAVPLPMRRDEAMAAAPVMEAALGADGHGWAPGQNPTELIPAVKMAPAVAPEDVQNAISGMVRLGVNKGDTSKLYNPIVDMIASLMGGYGEEADAFRAAAARGASTPINQRYTLPGAEKAQSDQREHDLGKKELDVKAKNYAADQRLAGTNYRTDSLSDLGRYRTDKQSEDSRYRTDTQSGDSRYRTDTQSADSQYRTDTQSGDSRYRTDAQAAARGQGTTPGSGKTPGVAQSPEETAKFASLLKMRISERTGGSDIDPKTMRSVEMAYEKIKQDYPKLSQSAAIELALDAHDFTQEKGFFSNGPVRGEVKGGGQAKPPVANAGQPPQAQKPQAPQAPKPQAGGDLKARADAAIAQIQAMTDISDEEKASRIAGVQNKLKQMLGGGQ